MGYSTYVTQQESDFRERMARFFDASTDGIILLDRDYRFSFINRRAQDIISAGDEILGTIIFESFPPTRQSPYIENYRRSMEDGLPGDFEAFYPGNLNLWMRIQTYPADGGIMIFFRDITPERIAQSTLQQKTEEAERQLAEIDTLYRTAPIGLALFDARDFRYLRLNDRQAAFFGMKPEQVIGRTLTEMAPNIEGLRELFEQVLRGEPVINHPIEGTLFNDSDNHRYWTVSYFPVFGPDGSVQAITTASLEITQQKKAEEALLQSEKLAVVGRLASSIAHEINNPLESVTNLIYIAKNSNDLTEIHEFLEMAELELRRASVITNQTLRFHKQSADPQACNVRDLFDSVLSIYQGRILNTQATIERRDRAIRPVHCFDGEIRQVISNLFNNALDAVTIGKGRILLRSREGTNWSNGQRGVILTMADSGSGMALETVARIFDPFFTTKGLTGTGLGLWVSKEIVDRHGGALGVRSSQRSHHTGTVFTMFLPFDAATRCDEHRTGPDSSTVQDRVHPLSTFM